MCPSTTNPLSAHIVTVAETRPGAQSCHQWTTGEFCCHGVVYIYVHAFSRFVLCKYEASLRKAAQPKMENVLKAIYRDKIAAVDHRRSSKCNGILCFGGAMLVCGELFILLLVCVIRQRDKEA